MDYGLGTITSQLILMIYSIKLDNLTIITSDFDVGVLFQYQSTDVPLCWLKKPVTYVCLNCLAVTTIWNTNIGDIPELQTYNQ